MYTPLHLSSSNTFKTRPELLSVKYTLYCLGLHRDIFSTFKKNPTGQLYIIVEIKRLFSWSLFPMYNTGFTRNNSPLAHFGIIQKVLDLFSWFKVWSIAGYVSFQMNGVLWPLITWLLKNTVIYEIWPPKKLHFCT